MPIESALAAARPMGAASLQGAPAWWVGRTVDSRAAVARWNGSTWVRVAPPFAGDGGLAGVAAWSSTAAWAVGWRKTATPRPAVARWNGSSWRKLKVPAGTGQASLTDVVALGSRSFVAVGSRLFAGRRQPYVLAKGPSGWKNLSPSFPATAEGGLTGVAAVDGVVWATGWVSGDDGIDGWVARSAGKDWERKPLASVDGYSEVLTDVDFSSASEGWVTGWVERRQGGGYAPLLQRWNGASWQPIATPWDEDASVMLASVAVGPDHVVAVAGYRMDDSGPGAIFGTLKGGSWTVAREHADPSWGLGTGRMMGGGFVAVTANDGPRAYQSCSTIAAAPAGAPAPVHATTSAPVTPGDYGAEPAAPTQPVAPTAGQAAHAVVARDVTASAGLGLTVSTYGGVAADFNGDSWPDVFINQHIGGLPLLMLGGPDGFRDAQATFKFADRHGCAVADVTGNGRLDLFCSIGNHRGTAPFGHELLVDVGQTGGSQGAREMGVLDATGRGRVAAFVRLAQDPLPDLFIGNKPMDMDGLPGLNRFFRNHDGEYFVPAPEMGLDTSQGAACADAADTDRDGNDEVFVCTHGLHVYVFDGSRWRDRTAPLGLAPINDVDVATADFDGDGRLDVAQLAGKELRISLNRGGDFQQSYSRAVAGALAVAVGDINGDGRADVFVLQRISRLMLLNDGQGTSFSVVDLPALAEGSADEVVALDYDRNGLTDFLVFNGRYVPGPLQLIAFVDAP